MIAWYIVPKVQYCILQMFHLIPWNANYLAIWVDDMKSRQLGSIAKGTHNWPDKSVRLGKSLYAARSVHFLESLQSYLLLARAGRIFAQALHKHMHG